MHKTILVTYLVGWGVLPVGMLAARFAASKVLGAQWDLLDPVYALCIALFVTLWFYLRWRKVLRHKTREKLTNPTEE